MSFGSLSLEHLEGEYLADLLSLVENGELTVTQTELKYLSKYLGIENLSESEH